MDALYEHGFKARGLSLPHVRRRAERGMRIMFSKEFIGVRELHGFVDRKEGSRSPLFNMYLTNEEIIRCRDCRYFTPEPAIAGRDLFGRCRFHDCGTSGDGYCHWSESMVRSFTAALMRAES